MKTTQNVLQIRCAAQKYWRPADAVVVHPKVTLEREGVRTAKVTAEEEDDRKAADPEREERGDTIQRSLKAVSVVLI